jgi:hypothetical protein
LALGLAACASSPGSGAQSAPVSTRPLRIHFVDWRSSQRLTLVDQSHTDRSKLYSSRRPLEEAGTKVTTDEVLEETLKFFREQGFFDHAQKGPAVSGDMAQSLEVETPEETLHIDLGRSTPPADAKVFRTCRDNFAALYNNVYQLQSVDRAPDWDAQQKSLQKRPGDTKPGGGGP